MPSRPEELRGLRARRYVRVSSEEQSWKYGPDGQHLTVDEVIRQVGLAEAGPAFVDEQSAWSRSAERPAFRALIAEARAGGYDVLVVAYFSRWSRDTEVALRIRRELHAAGVVILFADEGFVSSDDDAHERYLDEAVAAEKYSHRLSRTVRRTFAAKFERYGDQAGSPGLGFMRTPQPEARLAIDPATMPKVVALFERYAVGDVSYRELGAQTGIAEQCLREVLSNALYNGWAVRHRGRPDETRRPAPWRTSPPVSDELWAQVEDVRARRLRNGGSPRARRTYLVAKRLWCACGSSIRADSCQRRDGSIARRYRHEDCSLGGQVTRAAAVYEDPIAAQVQGITLDDELLAKLRALAGRPAPATHDLRRVQLQRELAAKAAAHARREITTPAYLAEHGRITAEIDALEAAPAEGGPMVDPERAIHWLRRIQRAWALVSEETRARLVSRIYARIVVEGERFVGVELTEEAKRHGLVLAMPCVVALARPTGLGHSRATTVEIPIVGRVEWEAAATAERTA